MLHDPLQFAAVRAAARRRLAARTLPAARLYGEYLQQLLRRRQQAAPARVGFERIRAEASASHRIDPTDPTWSAFQASKLLANDVVLACGDPPPVDPACARASPSTPLIYATRTRRCAARQTAKPAAHRNRSDDGGCRARSRGAESAASRIHAISRHGLMPAVQSHALPGAGRSAGICFAAESEGPSAPAACCAAFRALSGDLRGAR